MDDAIVTRPAAWSVRIDAGSLLAVTPDSLVAHPSTDPGMMRVGIYRDGVVVEDRHFRTQRLRAWCEAVIDMLDEREA